MAGRLISNPTFSPVTMPYAITVAAVATESGYREVGQDHESGQGRAAKFTSNGSEATR